MRESWPNGEAISWMHGPRAERRGRSVTVFRRWATSHAATPRRYSRRKPGKRGTRLIPTFEAESSTATRHGQ